MRALVTGGCGFIGANLVPRLTAEGYRVRVYDNLSRGSLDYIDVADNVEFIQGDIRNRNQLKASCQDVDCIVHLAAYGSVVESLDDPFQNFEINSLGTLNVLNAAKEANVKKMVFASTGGALIGDATPPVSEDSLPRPKSPYGASKLAGEAYCNAFGQSFKLPVVILRFANIYGPISAHKKGAITVFNKALLSNQPFVIYGDGSASRDFLHVHDLCTGILKSLEMDLPPASVFHMATGRETSVAELANLIKSIAGCPEHPLEYRESRPGEVHRNFANYERAAEMLGFSPSIALEEGLSSTWEWFIKQGEAILKVDATDS